MPESPALTFLRVLYAHSFECARRTSSRRTWAYGKALLAAVEGGLRFGEDDFEQVKGSPDLEVAYRTAVESGNVSACRALERFLQRPPFFVKGKRLFVGEDFWWDGKSVRVTSFGKIIKGRGSPGPVSTPCVNACWYTTKILDDHRLRTGVGIVRRYRITADELRAAERKRLADWRHKHRVLEKHGSYPCV